MLASPCTTCSIKTVDNSAYWHPDLYYQYSPLSPIYSFFFLLFFSFIFLLMHPRWPNGSLSLVPNGGLTVYYLARSGDNPSPLFSICCFVLFLYSVSSPAPIGIKLMKQQDLEIKHTPLGKHSLQASEWSPAIPSVAPTILTALPTRPSLMPGTHSSPPLSCV